MSGKPKVLFIDGEGPLVLKDLARDMATRIHRFYEPTIPGHLYFDTLSLYNAFLSEEGQYRNQPGDTLALLVPHLLAYGIRDEDLREEAEKTVIAPGVVNLIEALKQEGWEIRIISSAYSTLWEVVGPRLGIAPEQIASSQLSLNEMRTRLGWRNKLSRLVKLQERSVFRDRDNLEFAQDRFKRGEEIISAWQECQSETFPLIHNFYDQFLPREAFDPLNEVRVIGGSRKIDEIQRFSQELSLSPDQIIFVGDSITDDQAQRFVRENGGLAVALNGDRYAIRNAGVAVALEDRICLKRLLDAWAEGGLPQAQLFVESQGNSLGGKERQAGALTNEAHFSLVNPDNIDTLVEIHKAFREKSREGAVPLI